MKFLPVFSFWFLGLIWGSNFIYMKMAAGHISASQVVLFRVLFGFLPVLIYSAATRSLKLWHLRYSLHFFIMSLLATSVYYYGFVKGSSMLLSGVAGALSGSIPLFSFILAVIFIKEERVTIKKVTGVLSGFAGVLIIAGVFENGLKGANVEGVLYMVMGALSVGASFVYAKKFLSPLDIPAKALVTYQLGFALAGLFIVSDLHGIMNIWSDPHAAIGLAIGLGLLGTGLAYIIYYYIVKNLGAVAAASSTYVPPVVALIIGAFIVGENISTADYFATLLIFTGVFLTRGR